MKFKLLSNFRKDEQAGIMAFYLVMFITMMIGGGMAIDFMRHEIKREALQDALDRGVLAAAGTAQTANATTPAEIAAAKAAVVATVQSYMRIAGFDPTAQGLTVTANITPFQQRVDAAANFNLDTYFLRLTGINKLSGNTAAAAAVGVNNIEISLVVDISFSMAGAKIQDLRSAATNFTDQMLGGNRANTTTISLIPFAGQVAATTHMLDSYNFNRWHNYSNCVLFKPSDYTSTSLTTSTPLTQVQHFKFIPSNAAPEQYWCPKHELEILPFSNSKADLTTAINNLRETGSTSSYIGMKWATALLDPSARPVFNHLQAVGDVSSVLATRPANFNDTGTKKFVILMSDGENFNQYGMHTAPNFYYGYKTYEVIKDSNKPAGRSPNYNAPLAVIIQNGDWYTPRVAASPQRDAQYWDTHPIPLIPGIAGYFEQLTDGPTADTYLQSLCQAATDSGIVVFTIGYDVSAGSNAYNQLQQCASRPGFFYNVATSNLTVAFEQIRQTIQKLRLVN